VRLCVALLLINSFTYLLTYFIGRFSGARGPCPLQDGRRRPFAVYADSAERNNVVF